MTRRNRKTDRPGKASGRKRDERRPGKRKRGGSGRKIDFRKRVEEDAQEAQGSKYDWFSTPDGINIWKPPKDKGGTFFFDVIPYEVTSDNNPKTDKGGYDFNRNVKLHYNIGADNAPVICLRTFGKKCPVCEYSVRIAKGGDEEGAKELKFKERELYNLKVRGVPGISLFETSYHTFGKILVHEAEEQTGEDGINYKAFPNPGMDGYTLKCRFSKQSFAGNPFVELSRVDFLDRKKPVTDRDMDQASDLDRILKVLTYDQLKELLHEGEEDQGDDDYGDDDYGDDDYGDEDYGDDDDYYDDDGNDGADLPTDECPSGFDFGIDCDVDPEYCDDCEVYEYCREAFEERGGEEDEPPPKASRSSRRSRRPSSRKKPEPKKSTRRRRRRN